MIVDIEIKGPDAVNEIYDLRNFIREQGIDDLQLQLKEQPPVDGTMSILAVAGLVATIAGEMALKAGLEMVIEKPVHSLAEVIRQWLKKRKQEGKPDIEVYTEQQGSDGVNSFVTDSDGLTTQLHKLNFAIDVKNTRVLLIGNGSFDFNFPAIKPVKGNVEDFYRMLTDKKIMGIPAENITVALDKTSGEIEEQLLLLSRQPGVETLIIYYAGHGYKADAKKLFLIAKNSKKIGDHIISAVDFDFIKDVILKQSTASQKIVILDACHSGIATQGEDDYLAGFDVKGTYIFTSSSGDEVTYFNTENQHTFFTGEMINVLQNGLENNHEKIALKDIYETVARNLKEKNFPEPRYKNDLNIPLSDFYIARNLKFSVEKWKQKAKQLQLEGKTDEAIQEYNRLLQQYPADDAIKNEMAEMEEEQQYLTLINAADALFQEQEYEGAIEKYDEALQIRKEFSVLSRRNKCVEYLEVKKKLLAKNQPFDKTDITAPVPQHKEKEPAVKKNPVIVVPREEIKNNIIAEPVEPVEKKWYLVMLIHLLLFGFGLFYVSPAAKRKWLYPACVFLSWFIILLTFKVRSVAEDDRYFYRILFFASSITGYLAGLLDCLITLLKKMPLEKTVIPAMADEQSIAKARTWTYLLCGIWILQYILLAYSVYSQRRFIFDCERCVPFIDVATYFVFFAITPLFIFLLLLKSRWGWILAMAASALKIATAAGYFITAYRFSYTTGAKGLFTLVFVILLQVFLVYILERPLVKTYFSITEKLVNQVVLWSASAGILYIIIFLISLY